MRLRIILFSSAGGCGATFVPDNYHILNLFAASCPDIKNIFRPIGHRICSGSQTAIIHRLPVVRNMELSICKSFRSFAMTENHPPASQKTSFDRLISEGHEKLVWATPKAPLTFRFTWEKLVFSGRLSKLSTDQHRLILLGDMGPMPFSAEDPAFRDRLLNLVAWRVSGERIRFAFEPVRHRIYLVIDDVLEGDLTGTRLISSSIQSLFHARAYIQLAREVGWRHPGDTTPHNLNIITQND
jgi:hypothetical protein